MAETWNKGLIEVGDASKDAAQYVSGYVTKKLTSFDDERLDGRYPEFSRMSRRPGIGQRMMHEVASTLLDPRMPNLEDVPGTLRHGKAEWPLGRYLRRELRKMTGRDPACPDSVLQKLAEETQDIRDSAKADASSLEEQRFLFRDRVIRRADQKVANLQARQKIFKSRRTL